MQEKLKLKKHSINDTKTKDKSPIQYFEASGNIECGNIEASGNIVYFSTFFK